MPMQFRCIQARHTDTSGAAIAQVERIDACLARVFPAIRPRMRSPQVLTFCREIIGRISNSVAGQGCDPPAGFPPARSVGIEGNRCEIKRAWPANIRCSSDRCAWTISCRLFWMQKLRGSASLPCYDIVQCLPGENRNATANPAIG